MMTECWQPSASIAVLKQRAELVNRIRQFFIERAVLEVETPLLGSASIPDPTIQSIQTRINTTEQKESVCYLQTSPEFAMKRLLAAGSGSIFQICKAFRNDEAGRLHNPEFTMLEWYRVGFTDQQLMNEVDELLQLILNTQAADYQTYQGIFQQYLNLDPLTCSNEVLQTCARKNNIDIDSELSRDDWLNLLFSYLIEPHLGQDKPLFVHAYPASQAALARLNPEDFRVAERFEVFYQGYELANGFGELTNAEEQLKRFQKDLALRQAQNLPAIPIDQHLIAALEHGLPECAGVALGVDRLVMLALGLGSIREVMSFDFGKS